MSTAFAIVLLAVSGARAARPKAIPDTSNGTANLDAKLNERLNSFDSASRTLAQAVIDLAYEFQLPVGLERGSHGWCFSNRGLCPCSP